MRDYRRLDVWRMAHELAIDIYAATQQFPNEERFGLTSQLRRAAAGIGSNIAEGSGRNTGKDYARFLDMALGSLNEVEYQLLLAGDLAMLDADTSMALRQRYDVLRRKLLRFRHAVWPPEA